MRRRSWAKSYSASRSTISPRVSSSSKPLTTSSSERPLVARTVSTSNVRPITAAAASTWEAVSDTASRRALKTSCAPGPGRRSVSPVTSSSARYSGRPSLSVNSRSATPSSRPDAARQLVHVGCGQPAQGDPITQLGKVRAGVVGVGLVGAPGRQQQHPPPLQPPADVGERIDRRGIARVQVVHEHDSGGSGIPHHRQQLAGGVQEALAGAGLSERRRGRLAELWQQPGGLGSAVLGDVVAACLHGGSQQLGEHAVGEAALARMGARRHHLRAGSRPRPQKLLRQPRLADSRLSLDHDHAAVVGNRVIRGGQRPPRIVPAYQRL